MTRDEWQAMYVRAKEALDVAVPVGTPCSMVLLIASEEDGFEIQTSCSLQTAESMCRLAANFYAEKIKQGAS